MPVTRDPNHPDFPHGTAAGAQRGCTNADTCPSKPITCVEARRRQAVQAKLRLLRGQPGRLVDATPMLDHIDRLLAAVPNAHPTAIAKLAGVAGKVPGAARRSGKVTRTTAAKVLAVTEVDLAKTVTLFDVELVRHMARKLQACGYPMRWIEAQTNSSLANIVSRACDTRQQTHVKAAKYQALKDLFDRIDGRVADPRRDNIPLAHIRAARTNAARAGYYPVAAYDDEGNLNPRAIPDHPWAQADDRCAKLVELAHSLAATGSRAEAIRAAGNTPGDEGRATRIVRRLGITFTYEVTDETSGKTSRFVYEPHEARQINRDIFDRIETTWETYAAGTTGPVYAALTLGLTDVTMRGGGTLPSDHPEVIAWRAEQTAEDELDQAPRAA